MSFFHTQKTYRFKSYQKKTAGFSDPFLKMPTLTLTDELTRVKMNSLMLKEMALRGIYVGAENASKDVITVHFFMAAELGCFFGQYLTSSNHLKWTRNDLKSDINQLSPLMF